VEVLRGSPSRQPDREHSRTTRPRETLVVEAFGQRMTHDAQDRGDDEGDEGDPGAHDNPHDTDANPRPGGRFTRSADSAERNDLVGAYDSLRGCGAGKVSCVSCVMHVIREKCRPGGWGILVGRMSCTGVRRRRRTPLHIIGRGGSCCPKRLHQHPPSGVWWRDVPLHGPPMHETGGHPPGSGC